MVQATDKVYGEAGYEVIYIDDWYSHHEDGGDIHCGTNTIRVPQKPWWDTKPFLTDKMEKGVSEL